MKVELQLLLEVLNGPKYSNMILGRAIIKGGPIKTPCIFVKCDYILFRSKYVEFPQQIRAEAHGGGGGSGRMHRGDEELSPS